MRLPNSQTATEIPIPTTDDELWYSVKILTGIEIPRVAVCVDKGHVAPFTAFADAYFARHSMSIWKGSRGLAGKTLMLGLLGWMETVFLGANGAILGGSGEQSKRVHSYQQLFWEHRNAPRTLLKTDPTATKTFLKNGGTIVCLTASQKSARGEHPQRLRLDEVDEMELAILDAAQGQTMKSTLALRLNGVEPQTVASSTHQHSDGTMTELLRRAAERGWPVYEWCYHESMTGWLTEAEKDRKRNEVTAEMWRVEYELGEPSIGNRAILTESVDAMFDRKLGVFEGNPGEYIETEPPVWFCSDGQAQEIAGEPITCIPDFSQVKDDEQRHVLQHGFLTSTGKAALEESIRMCSPHGKEGYIARYATGTDWAKEQDWTVIATFRVDVRPARLVAYLRIGRLNWKLMVQRFDDRMARYGGRAVHDATGVGNVVRDYMETRAEGMILGGRKYDDLMTEYIAAVERGDLIAPHIRHPYTEHKYASMDAIYGSEHMPDTVCAFALAYRASKRAPRSFGPA